MNAARLREAARVLRDPEYIVTMDPDVGLALADWLDTLADHGASILMPMESGAFVVADLILGDTK